MPSAADRLVSAAKWSAFGLQAATLPLAMGSRGIVSMNRSRSSAEHRFAAATDVCGGLVAWRPLGEVLALRLRDADAVSPREVDESVAVDGSGLLGDKHLHPLSPRQVLLASSDTYEELGLEPMILRENLLVNFSTKGLQSSGLLRIGRDVVLWLTFQCEACGHLERRHPGIVKSINGRRGMLARVLRGGAIKAGDQVSYVQSDIAPLADRWQDRIAGVLDRVPADKLVEFRQLARLAGVPRSYCRVFPKLLSQLPPAVAGRAQAGDVSQAERRWTGAELFEVPKTVSNFVALNH